MHPTGCIIRFQYFQSIAFCCFLVNGRDLVDIDIHDIAAKIAADNKKARSTHPVHIQRLEKRRRTIKIHFVKCTIGIHKGFQYRIRLSFQHHPVKAVDSKDDE